MYIDDEMRHGFIIDPGAEHLAFVGDTLFRGGIGTAQYPGGDPNALRDSVFKTLFSLPEETLLLPGHGASAILGEEKRRHAR